MHDLLEQSVADAGDDLMPSEDPYDHFIEPSTAAMTSREALIRLELGQSRLTTELTGKLDRLSDKIDSATRELRAAIDSGDKVLHGRIDSVEKDVRDLETRIGVNEQAARDNRRLAITTFVGPLAVAIIATAILAALRWG